MVALSKHHADVLIAFMESFDLRTTGAWAQVEEGMREDFGIEDPEGEIEEIKSFLQG